MITWQNRYTDESQHYAGEWLTPENAAFVAAPHDSWVRLEMRIDGHHFRPPVGMQAGQASHRWRDCGCGAGLGCPFECLSPKLELRT